MSDNRPQIGVTSDTGGNRGLLFALALLVLVLVAAVWFFNQSGAGNPSTEVTIDLPAGEVNPGTETSILP